jgi:hypothetical protein
MPCTIFTARSTKDIHTAGEAVVRPEIPLHRERVVEVRGIVEEVHVIADAA